MVHCGIYGQQPVATTWDTLDGVDIHPLDLGKGSAGSRCRTERAAHLSASRQLWSNAPSHLRQIRHHMELFLCAPYNIVPFAVLEGLAWRAEGPSP